MKIDKETLKELEDKSLEIVQDSYIASLEDFHCLRYKASHQPNPRETHYRVSYTIVLHHDYED